MLAQPYQLPVPSHSLSEHVQMVKGDKRCSSPSGCEAEKLNDRFTMETSMNFWKLYLNFRLLFKLRFREHCLIMKNPWCLQRRVQNKPPLYVSCGKVSNPDCKLGLTLFLCFVQRLSTLLVFKNKINNNHPKFGTGFSLFLSLSFSSEWNQNPK